jgi:hypothetical protein
MKNYRKNCSKPGYLHHFRGFIVGLPNLSAQSMRRGGAKVRRIMNMTIPAKASGFYYGPIQEVRLGIR